MPEEINVTAQALMRGTRSSGMGKIIAVATGHYKNLWPFGPRWAGIYRCISASMDEAAVHDQASVP
jgi:hypothetical protein